MTVPAVPMSTGGGKRSKWDVILRHAIERLYVTINLFLYVVDVAAVCFSCLRVLLAATKRKALSALPA